jgi:hypothetical protein
MAAATFHSPLGILITYFQPAMRLFILTTSFLFTLITTSCAWTNNRSLEPLGDDDTIVTARDVDIDRTCRHLRTLTKLSDIANNKTALDATEIHGRLAQARVDWIKNHSADITAKLGKLTSNSTLTTECDTINAQRDAVRECKALDTLKRLVNSPNGQTGLDQGPAADFLNEEQKQNLQQKFEKASLKLQELKSNATLMDLCNNNAVLQQNGAIGSRKYPHHPAYARCVDM